MDDYIFRVSSSQIHWKQIRAELDQLVTAAIKARRMTQERIAIAGGLSDQNYVSKVLRYGDDSDGPSITHLLKLLKGIGVTKASEFFVLVEQRAEGASPPAPTMTLTSDQDQLERELGRRLLELLHRAGVNPAPRRPRGRPRKPGRSG